MSTPVLNPDNLFDFFHHQVQEANAHQPCAVSEQTSVYLANLLVERTRSDRPVATEQTLAELHLSATNAPPIEQARKYRELGDRALYILGYFTESLARSHVSASYYTDMGSSAYLRADWVFKRWFSDAFGPVFSELSTKFERCVSVLEAVRIHQSDTSEDLIRIYQRWLETGSEQYAARLRTLGVQVPRKIEE